MSVEPPHIVVLSDPAIVFIFVALFAGALTLALLFASPWLGSVPSNPAPEAVRDLNEGNAGAPVQCADRPRPGNSPAAG